MQKQNYTKNNFSPFYHVKLWGILLSLGVLVTPLSLYSQCPPGDVTLNSQADVDAFLVNYPSCTIINGDLYIGKQYLPSSDIVNLSSLQNLTSVVGSVHFNLNDLLLNCVGLENLSSIGENLIFNKNSSIINFHGLGNLVSIGNPDGYFIVIGNPSLTNLSGLENLTTIGGDFLIYSNDGLSSLSGVENLVSCSELDIQYNISLSDCAIQGICNVISAGIPISIQNNQVGGQCNSVAQVETACEPCPPGDVELNSQADVDAFVLNYPNCTKISGELWIGGSPESSSDIVDISGLHNLTEVTNKLFVYHNSSLVSLAGLENITTIGERLTIYKNSNLISLSSLSNLSSVGKMVITSNNLLQDLQGLEQITSPQGIAIGYNNSMTSLAGLENLSYVGGELSIFQNPSLTSLSVLSNLTLIESGLGIENNPLLNSLEGLDNVASIGGQIKILNLDGITDLSVFSNLESMPDNLIIQENDDLEDLTGFENITSIGGFLLVSHNISLTGLKGLENVDSIGMGLAITNNSSLVDLSDLANVSSILGGFYIVENPLLENCAILGICQALTEDFVAIVENNNPNGQCNSISQLEVACNPCPMAYKLYVDDSATGGSDDGSSWSNAFTTLQDALDLANECQDISEIWVAQGTYYPDEGMSQTNDDRTSSFVMQNDLAIYGGFNGTENTVDERDWKLYPTILSGDLTQNDGPSFSNRDDNSLHVIKNDDNGLNNSAVIDGFIIKGGNADGTAPHYEDIGGGMWNNDASPSISNCSFIDNQALSGGGLYNSGNNNIDNCSFLNNQADDGGGAILSSTYGTMSNCKFSGNEGSSGPGGLFVPRGEVDLINCSFTGNKGESGVGLRVDRGLYNIINCTFSGNFSNSNEGVIEFGKSKSEDVNIYNLIIWGNNTNIDSDYFTLNHSIIEGGYAGPGVNNMDADPFFIQQPDFNIAPTTDGNVRLSSCSPAVDAGYDAQNSTAVDLDGLNRKFEAIPGGSLIDMGAYEYQVACNNPPVAVCQDIVVPADENCQGVAAAIDFDGGSTDPDNDPLTFSISPEGPYSLGVTNIILTVTDPSGATDECSTTITVSDLAAPVPDEALLDEATDECSVFVEAPTATDNCAGSITATTTDPTSYSEQGTYTILWTYDDGNGNSATQSQTVIVDDVTAPVPDVATLSDANGECLVEVEAPTATDNCVGSITGTTTDSISYSEQGTYTILWKYDDGNGNISTQSQMVIVDDVTSPVPDAATLADATGECSVELEAPTATDNCVGDIIGTTTDSISYSEQGTYTILWTYDDGNGNIATQTQTVIVNDTTPPDILCENLTVYLDESGTTSITGQDIDNGSTDNCGTVILSLDGQTAYDCSDVGSTITVILSAEDGNGNSSTCNAEVTISDANLADTDHDGLVDACDVCPLDPDNDIDGDGICGDVDNCINEANTDQVDSDGDGEGDVCDVCPLDPDNDIDGDGICGDVDNCPEEFNPEQEDLDVDGIGNVCDAVVSVCDAIKALEDKVESLSLPGNTEGFLLDKLQMARQKFQQGNINAAIGNLNAFNNKVNAKMPVELSPEDAADLIAISTAISDAMLNGNTNCTNDDGQSLAYVQLDTRSSSKSTNMGMHIYPNPASGQTTIQLEGVNEKSTLSLVDQLGKTIFTQNVVQGQTRIGINLSKYNLPSGIYFVSVVSSEHQLVKRLVVK